MKTGFAHHAIVLGLLAATGPFAIDTYLPALPTIVTDLDASTASVQMSLMAFFAAVALFQLVYGQVSDVLGRRRPLYFGLALFVLASFGCAFAPSAEALIAFRFLQGVGACAAMTIPRAIVRDLHTGPEAARLMSLIMLVFSVSPILAPLTGSALIAIGGWRSIFVAVSAIGVLGVLLVAFALEETRPREKRIEASLRVTVGSYLSLLRDRHYLGIVLIGGFGLASFYAFLANSSFVYVDYFGLTPTQYGLAFAVNAIGFIGLAQFSSALARRFGFGHLVRIAAVFFAAFAVILVVLVIGGAAGLWVTMSMLFLVYTTLGLIIPTAAVLALDAHGPIAGMASAMMGTIQMLIGAVVIVVAAQFYDGTALPMVASIAACAIGALTMSLLTIRTRDGFARRLAG